MKAIVCEMCGGQEFSKEDGFYVCQHCRTKYDPEEAKKLMIEVSGSVEIDNSKKLDNLFILARRAKQENNERDAANYYAQIALENPDNWEAQFYKSYYVAMQTNIAGISSAANSVKNSGINALKLIKNNVEPDAQKKKDIAELSEKICIFRMMLTSSAEKHYNGIDSEIQYKYKGEYTDRILSANNMVYVFGQNIDILFGASYKDYTLLCYHDAYDDFLKRGLYDAAKQVATSINKYDPAFNGVQRAENARKSAKQAEWGCAITLLIIFIIGMFIWWNFLR